jgi:PAS domain S-box-containing protein
MPAQVRIPTGVIFVVCCILAASAAAGALLLFRFIRKLGQAREALAQSQERLSVTLHASGVAVWSWEIAPNICTADDNSCLLFGLPLGQFPKTVEGFAALIHPDDRERVQKEIAAALEQGADYRTDFRIVRPEGGSRYLAARGKVYYGEGGRPYQLTGVCWDVTDRH